MISQQYLTFKVCLQSTSKYIAKQGRTVKASHHNKTNNPEYKITKHRHSCLNMIKNYVKSNMLHFGKQLAIECST